MVFPWFALCFLKLSYDFPMVLHGMWVSLHGHFTTAAPLCEVPASQDELRLVDLDVAPLCHADPQHLTRHL